MPPPIEEQHAIASNGVERRALVVVPGEAAGDVDDMITIDNLTIETILSNLVGRYARDQIYTNIGPSILVAVNPYKHIPVYGDKDIERYAAIDYGADDFVPHIFHLAQLAYTNMLEERRDQSVIVSGESGSGKTESCKFLIQHLAAVTHNPTNVDQQLILANCLCESFGNAKTVRNDNSSRFGKFIQINFNENGHISGAKITKYLLEKSRLVGLAQNERNYHIFYEITGGAPQSLKEELQLQGPDHYRCLNKSESYTISAWNEEDRFKRTQNALTVIGVSDDEQMSIWKLLAGILHLSNAKFVENKESHGDVGEIENPEVLTVVSKLIGVQESELTEALLHKKMNTPDGVILTPLSKEQVVENAEALAKKMYSTLFDWLIMKMNQTLDTKSTVNSICLLDIFGFENFKSNSFEQLCINYTNEQLQQYFNEHIFKLEQQEYDAENIEWNLIAFSDNLDVINLIGGNRPPGILGLVNEECRFPRGTDKTYLEKLKTQFQQNKERFSVPRLSQAHFCINHFAGDVQYDVTGFLEKNKDLIQDNLIDALRASSNSIVAFVNTLEPRELKKTGSRGGLGLKQTVAAAYQKQLEELMSVLNQTRSYFVRCVRPNEVKKADHLTNDYVTTQLINSGMLETIKIRKSGYPCRYRQQEFFDRYRVFLLGHARSDGPQDLPSKCRLIFESLDHAEFEMWQIGKTKVFMREEEYTCIEELRKQHRGIAATIIQKNYRRHVARTKFLILKQRSVLLQSSFRWFLSVINYKRERARVMCLQSYARMVNARRSYLLDRQRAYDVQTLLHMLSWRRSFLKQRAASIQLQSFVRMCGDRRYFLKERSCVVRVQAFWRMLHCRRQWKQDRSSVIAVQSRSRAWQARQRYLAARERVILLQSFCRSHQAQSVRRQAIRATIVLQSFVRMSIARKELLRAMSAARLMQSLTRTVQARKMYRHQRASTFLLQARFLTHVHSQRRQNRLAAVALLQRFARSSAAIRLRLDLLREFHLKRESMIRTLQIWTRCWRAKRQFQREAMQCRQLQCFVRMCLAAILRKTLAEAKRRTAATSLQTAVRAWKTRREFLNAQSMVVTVQAAFRQWKGRRELERLFQARQRKAAVIIQSLIRSNSCQREKKELLSARRESAALTIQTVSRMYLDGKRRRQLQAEMKVEEERKEAERREKERKEDERREQERQEELRRENEKREKERAEIERREKERRKREEEEKLRKQAEAVRARNKERRKEDKIMTLAESGEKGLATDGQERRASVGDARKKEQEKDTSRGNGNKQQQQREYQEKGVGDAQNANTSSRESSARRKKSPETSDVSLKQQKKLEGLKHGRTGSKDLAENSSACNELPQTTAGTVGSKFPVVWETPPRQALRLTEIQKREMEQQEKGDVVEQSAHSGQRKSLLAEDYREVVASPVTVKSALVGSAVASPNKKAFHSPIYERLQEKKKQDRLRYLEQARQQNATPLSSSEKHSNKKNFWEEVPGKSKALKMSEPEEEHEIAVSVHNPFAPVVTSSESPQSTEIPPEPLRASAQDSMPSPVERRRTASLRKASSSPRARRRRSKEKAHSSPTQPQRRASTDQRMDTARNLYLAGLIGVVVVLWAGGLTAFGGSLFGQ